LIIQSLRIQNLRCIIDKTITFQKLTTLVGSNGAGKSTVLYALNLFYTPSKKAEYDDFYNQETDREIAISVTYCDLSDEAKELFSKYMEGEKLTIERVFRGEGSTVLSAYHGSSLQYPGFDEIRSSFNSKDRGATAKGNYQGLRAQGKYSTLPGWTKIDEVKEFLKVWEMENQGECVRARDEGQFFGFTEVAQGYLGKYSRFLFIPAVRDASGDAEEGRGSVLTELMNLVVRSTIANRKDLVEFKEETAKKFHELMNPDNFKELMDLEGQLATTLKTFVPTASVNLQWLPPGEVDLPLPKVDIQLVEDGYSSVVRKTGHGLQRAFILTMLQHLTIAKTSQNHQSEKEEPPPNPNLILAIEEPELYQHPSRQRHLSDVLSKLSEGSTPGVAKSTQIIFSTHSPLFIGIDKIDQVRLLKKKENGEGNPLITEIISTDLDEVADKLWTLDGEKGVQYSGDTLLPRLRAIMTPWMNEGFFSDVVVLVEGEDDRAALIGVASSLEINFDAMGISIIPCGGKSNIDRPFIIFNSLEIPTYVIWDGDENKGATEGNCEGCGRPLDKKADPNENRRLLTFCGGEVVDWPDVISENFSCFKFDLESTLREEIGDDFYTYLQECQDEFGIPKRKHALKNPEVIKSIILKAKEKGRESKSMNEIVDRIIKMKE
jgi:putative ATP-dependent endonuclease of the OLD family